MLKYESPPADGDIGYSPEVSRSGSRVMDILPLLEVLDFQDPNTLESRLPLQAKHLARTKPAMICPVLSVAFREPVNRLQEIFQNHSGPDPRWSIEQLADKFHQGQPINVALLDVFTRSACHQEEGFSFELRR